MYINYFWLPYLILIFKTLLICLFAIGTRGTLPRYRFDQFTQLNWKHFIFIWLGFLIYNSMYFILFF